jgi:hypothetical protein
MSFIKERFDQSINFLTQNTNATMKVTKNIFPTVPISMMEQLRQTLVKKLSSEYNGLDARLVHRAVNEAYALACLTMVPFLLLPALAEEKVQSAAAWSARQLSLLRGGTLAPAA